MEKIDYCNYNEETFISPYSKKLIDRLIDAEEQELVTITNEAMSAKLNTNNEANLISHEEAQTIIELARLAVLEFKDHQSYN